MSLNLYVGPDAQPDKYRLVRLVGRGGEATLYLAEVSLAGQTEPVVVKVLNSDVTSNDEQFAELSAKWGEQAELLRFINRLGVVGVREHFEGAPEHPADGAAGNGDERALYLVMNYVEGLDLRDWRAENVVEGPRGRREVLRCLEQIAQVLDVLHSGRATPSKRVVVHGDLSPGNIMISVEGQATLVDFGLSRIAARHMTARPWFTPGYAAPEIFNGEYSPATDRYAFGAIAYFALTGEDPPPAPEQLRERLGALPVLAEAGEARREFVLRMFSVEPSERPEASEWVRALRSLATSSVPWTAPASEPAGFGDPGDALGTASPVSPDSGDGVTGGSAPPEGARFAGPPPVSTPADGTTGGDTGTAPGTDGPPQEPRRPVGGMRGVPTAQPPAARIPSQPGAPQGDPPTAAAPSGGSVPGPRRPPVGPPPPNPAGPPRPRGAMDGGTAPYGVAAHGGPMTNHPGQAPGPHPSGPLYGGPRATGAFAAPPRPPASEKPKRGSRRPVVVGLAILAVVFTTLGAGGTYVVMDRVVPLFSESNGTNLAEVASEPSDDPEPSEPVTDDVPVDADKETGVPEPSGTPSPDADGPYSLSQLNWVDSEDAWEWGRAEMDGEVHNNALVTEAGCSVCDHWVEYNLSRSWGTFDATVGLDDNSRSGKNMTFTVYADGERVATETVTLGETVDIEADVSGALRLRLEVESDDTDLVAVWAAPTLVGD